MTFKFFILIIYLFILFFRFSLSTIFLFYISDIYFYVITCMLCFYIRKDIVKVINYIYLRYFNIVKIIFLLSLFLISFNQYLNLSYFLNIFTYFFIITAFILVFNFKNNINKIKLNNWWFIIAFICITALFLFTRLYFLDYLDGSDLYNDVAVKGLYDSGYSFYIYSFCVSSQIMLSFANIFGFSIPILKIPFIIFSFITLICIYFIAKNINKTVALISMFLFTISPWAIIVSKMTRDYSFDCMIATIIILLCINIYKNSDTIKKHILSFLYMICIMIGIYYFSQIYQRAQLQLSMIIPFITFIFIIYKFLCDYKINLILIQIFKKYYFLIVSIFVIFITFFIYIPRRFTFGFIYNKFYFDLFFNSSVTTPIQWFNSNNLSTIFLFFIFILPLIYHIKNKSKYIQEIILFYTFFFFVLFVFMFKFTTHLNYKPTRYIYFIFPVYCIIFSYSFYIILNLFREYIIKIFLIILYIAFFINFLYLQYAVYPIYAWENEKIAILRIDNLGTGHFQLKEVADFIQENVLPEYALVVDDRYNHFIFLLDKKVDKFLVRRNEQLYDSTSEFYVEANVFGFHELEMAVNENKKGFFVTNVNKIINNNEKTLVEIQEENFRVYNTFFQYITTINNCKFYRWEKIK